MKAYPVGSLCVIVTAIGFPQFVGRECTVIVSNKMWSDGIEAYEIDIQGEPTSYRAEHSQLRLKRFPPEQDAWCREVMKTVLKPVDILEPA